MPHSGELILPPEAREDPDAGEVLRAWVINGALQCSLRPTIWEEPGNWGLLLADVARHVASALREHSGLPAGESLAAIRAAFEAELDHPTDDTTGEFHDKGQVNE